MVIRCKKENLTIPQHDLMSADLSSNAVSNCSCSNAVSRCMFRLNSNRLLCAISVALYRLVRLHNLSNFCFRVSCENVNTCGIRNALNTVLQNIECKTFNKHPFSVSNFIHLLYSYIPSFLSE